MQFQTLKTSVLILSAVSAVSAEFSRSLFTPRTTDFNVDASVKNIFQRAPFRNMFQNLQTAGRRLDKHEGATGPMSEACKAECPKAPDLIAEYMKEENTKAMSEGDMSWMCPMMDTVKCMAAKACQEGDKEDDEDDDGAAAMECLCACPDIAKMEKMEPADYCKAGNPMECLSTKSECSAMFTKEFLKDGSKADHDEGMRIMCAMVDAKCEEKGEKMGTCAGDAMKTWDGKSCEDAANDGSLATSANKDDCCAAGKKLVDCYSLDCIKLGMEYATNKAKDGSAAEKEAAEKDKTKNFNIGKACPASGMPASEADLAGEGTVAASGAWVSLPHAVPFVAMLSALYA